MKNKLSFRTKVDFDDFPFEKVILLEELLREIFEIPDGYHLEDGQWIKYYSSYYNNVDISVIRKENETDKHVLFLLEKMRDKKIDAIKEDINYLSEIIKELKK